MFLARLIYSVFCFDFHPGIMPSPAPLLDDSKYRTQYNQHLPPQHLDLMLNISNRQTITNPRPYSCTTGMFESAFFQNNMPEYLGILNTNRQTW